MKRKPVPFGVWGVACLLLLGLGSTVSFAQSPTVPASLRHKVTLEARNMDVREALRSIFKQAGAFYAIAPGIQGSIDGEYQNLAMEDALRLVLRQVGATWRTEGGVIQIVPHEATQKLSSKQPFLATPDPVYGPPMIVSPAVEEGTAITSDTAFLYVVRRGVVHKIDKDSMKEVGKLSIEERRIRITY